MESIIICGIIIVGLCLFIVIRGIRDYKLDELRLYEKEVKRSKQQQKERYDVKKIYKIPSCAVSPHYLLESILTKLIKGKVITKKEADKMIEESKVKFGF